MTMTPGDGIVAGRFPLGQLVITRAASGQLTPEEIAAGIGRHARGDWGDISAEDAAENELSVREGFRLLSAYGRGARRFWVITEADRSVTTVLLPEDY
jgi:hypothetical protein